MMDLDFLSTSSSVRTGFAGATLTELSFLAVKKKQDKNDPKVLMTRVTSLAL